MTANDLGCRRFLTVFSTIILLSVGTGVPALAQDIAQSPTEHRLSLGGGIFRGQRGEFRELYNSGPALGIDFDRCSGSRLNYGASALFRHLNGLESDTLRYMELSFSPYLTYSVLKGTQLQPYIGAGLGGSYRRIKFDNFREGFDPFTQLGDWHDAEWSGFFTLMTGIDIGSFGALIPGLRFVYNYHFTGDPTIGDFGNTGGLTMLARIGIRLDRKHLPKDNW